MKLADNKSHTHLYMALHHHCYNFKLLLTHFKGPRIVMVGCQFLSPVHKRQFFMDQQQQLLDASRHVTLFNSIQQNNTN